MITLTVRDSNNATRSETFTVTVNSVNDDPVATNDTYETNENTPIVMNVLANDDVDLPLEGDTLHILSVVDTDSTSYGTFEVFQDATDGNKEKLRYTPNANWDRTENGIEVLQYQMTDAAGHVTSTATATITIKPVNDAPVISAITDKSFFEDDPAGTGTISFTVTDEEDDDNLIDVSAASSNQGLIADSDIHIVNPESGSASDRTVSMTSLKDQNGETYITLTAKDSNGLTATSIFKVTVNPVDDDPVNGDDEITVVEDTVTDLNVLQNDDIDATTNPDLENLTITGITVAPQHGSAQIISNGKLIRYTPAADNNLDDSFEYSMVSKDGKTDTFQVIIHMTPVNDAPDIQSTIIDQNVSEGQQIGPLSFTVSDVDDDAQSLSVTAASSNQILIPKANIDIINTSGANRTVTITPNGKWNGSSTITLTVKDDDNAWDSGSIATFKVYVAAVNEAPVANDDLNYVINEDTTAVLNVLGNDTDADLLTNSDTETMTITSVESVDNGTATIIDGGKKIEFVPNANWNGTEEFTYTISDTAGLTDTATVRVKVNGRNDTPVAVNDTAETNEDTAVTVDVLHNDSDIDTDAMLNNDPYNDPANETITVMADGFSGVDNGTASVVDGKVVFTPLANWNGTETFTYTVRDVAGATATANVTVNVLPVNDAPSAINDTSSTAEDTPVTVNVLNNDSDIDLSSTLNHPVTDMQTVTIAGVPAKGSVKVNPDNTVTYTPLANWNGTETFTYTVTDKGNASATATVTMTVNAVNDAPVAQDDTASTNEDTAVAINALANDSDVDTDTQLNANAGAESLSVKTNGFSGVEHGSVSIVDGKIVFTPLANWNGTETFTYTVRDVTGATDTADVTVTVNAVNDAPVAANDAANTNESTDVIIDALANDSDVDTSAALNTNPGAETLSLVEDGFSGVDHGTVSIVDGKIVFEPQDNWNGIESFTYTMRDHAGVQVTASVIVTVQQVNDAPVAGDDAATTNEDTAVTIDALANDTDIDKDGTLNANPAAEVLSVVANGFSGVEHGSVSIVDGKIVFTPQTNWNGTETFTYTVRDVTGATDTGDVTVTVNGVNDTPVAVNDTASTNEDNAVTIDVLSNDSDVDMDISLNQNPGADPANEYLTILPGGFTGLDHGSVKIVDGKIAYTPDAYWNGTEIFSYTVQDVSGATATAQATVNVLPKNDSPVAAADTATTDEDNSVTVHVLDNDTDVDMDREGDELLVDSVADVENGVAVISADHKTIDFTPSANWNGTEVFTYAIKDEHGALSSATVTVTVKAVNDGPMANDDTALTQEDNAVVINVLDNDTDIDLSGEGDILTIVSVSGVDNGAADIASNKKTLTFTPDINWNGTEAFSYIMQDKEGVTSTADVTVTVDAVNDAPTEPTLLTPVHDAAYKDGQTVHVTWTMSTDVENDTIFYKLYFYDGSAWTLLNDHLTDTQYDHVLTGTGLVTKAAAYKVEAWDQDTCSEDTGETFIIDNQAPQNVTATLMTASGNIKSSIWSNQDVAFSLSGGKDLLPFTYQYAINDNLFYATLAEGEKVVFTENGQYTIHYRAVDALGNIFEDSRVVQIDKLIPAQPLITVSTTEPTNKPVVLALELLNDPGGSGNKTVVLPDGHSISAAEPISFTVGQNGVYTFVITDVAGNSREISVTVSNIDMQAPAITVRNNGYLYGTWRNMRIPVVLVYSDSGLGIASETYFVSDMKTGTGDANNYREELMFEDDGTYYIHAFAADKAGNTAQAVFGPYLIDQTPPVVDYQIESTGTSINLTDIGSGLATVTLPDGSVVEAKDGVLNLDFTQSGDYVIQVKDQAGNITKKVITIVLSDKITEGNNLSPSPRPSADGSITRQASVTSGAFWNVLKIDANVLCIGGIMLLVILIVLLLLLIANRQIKLKYVGFKQDGKPFEKVEKQFAWAPRKHKVLTLNVNRAYSGVAIREITVTFTRGFTKRMRQRDVLIVRSGKELSRINIAKNQTGRWSYIISL